MAGAGAGAGGARLVRARARAAPPLPPMFKCFILIQYPTSMYTRHTHMPRHAPQPCLLRGWFTVVAGPPGCCRASCLMFDGVYSPASGALRVGQRNYSSDYCVRDRLYNLQPRPQYMQDPTCDLRV